MESGKSINPQSLEQFRAENPVIQTRNKAREKATPYQKRTAEIQSARYETALLRLMDRSGDNLGLINALNKFTKSLDTKSLFGSSDEALAAVHIDKLTNFFEEMTNNIESPNFYHS
jgi:hypothetical protein